MQSAVDHSLAGLLFIGNLLSRPTCKETLHQHGAVMIRKPVQFFVQHSRILRPGNLPERIVTRGGVFVR